MTYGVYQEGYPAHGQYPYPLAGGGGGSEGGMSLVQLLQAIRRRWLVVVLSTALVFGVAWFVIPEDQAMYRATSVVRLRDPSVELTAGLASTQETRSIDYLTSQVHVILSESVLSEVIDREGLRLLTYPALPARLLGDVSVSLAPADSANFQLSFAPGRYTVASSDGQRASAAYGEPVEIGRVAFTVRERPEIDASTLIVRPLQSVIQLMQTRLSADPRYGAASIIDITYLDPDPDRARDVVNSVAYVYEAFNTGAVQEQARRRREFLGEQLIEAQATLERQQQLLREFQQSDRLFGARQRSQEGQAELMALDAERRRVENERRIYRDFLDRVERASGPEIDRELRQLMAIPGTTPSPLLQQLFAQLSGYLAEHQSLVAAGVAPTHPDVVRLSQLIESTRVSVVDAARTQVSSFDERILAIDEQRARTGELFQSVPELDMEQARLEEEIASARAMVNALQTEYQRALMSESLDVGEVQVLDLALQAVPASVGRRIQGLIIALIFGMLLGGGGALFMEMTNKTLRWRAEAEGVLSVPGLAIIPNIPPPEDQRNGLGPAKRLRLGSGEEEARKIAPQDFNNMAAEAYRMLRTNLAFLSQKELRSLVVTSASSGEGKTTTAVNLAVAFARLGRRVVLVDCDLRRPRLHTVFGMPQSPGFTELMLETTTPLQAIRPTAIQRLFLLPRGEFNEDATEMLSGDRGRSLVKHLCSFCDLVIFDTSPVLLTADAAAVAPYTDGVLLVVRAGVTPKEAAQQTIKQLQVVGANVLGFVLNDPSAVSEQYGDRKYAKTYYPVEV